MKILKHLPAFVAEFKKEHGRLPNATVFRCAISLDKTARKFKRKGREDGAQGKPVPGDEAFSSWGRKSFGDDRDFDGIVSLMKNAYMDGYRAGIGRAHREG